MKTTRAVRLLASLTTWSGRRCLAVMLVASLGGNALAAEASGEALNAAVRRIVMNHCGSCYDGSRVSANPAALKIFDLRDEDWTARMSSEQVLKLNGRGKSLRPADRARLTKFVNRVLENRKASSQRGTGAGPTRARMLSFPRVARRSPAGDCSAAERVDRRGCPAS